MVWCGVMSGVTMCKANRSRAYATVLGGAVAIAGLVRKNHPRRSMQWLEALRSAVLVRLLIAPQKLGCLTCARRVSDAVAFATLTERTFGKLLSMTGYLAQRAVIRTIAAAGPEPQ